MDTGWIQPAAASVLTQPTGYEYLLVVRPNAAVAEQVLAEKQLFAGRYSRKSVLKTPPHIVLAGFVAREEMEDTIIRWMHRITSVQQCFTVSLNNYSGIPPHTIYLRVQDALPFTNLALQLKAVNEYIRGCSCPPMQFVTRPYLGLAHELTGEVYEQAMPLYSRQTFHADFEAGELVLLRRRNQFEEPRQINVFKLLPQQ